MTRLPDAMISALEARYAIEAELGSGGSGTVFRARDLRHDRTVALKVLHPVLAALLGSERFGREVAFTARLNHPHILPLLDSGEADGLLYYVTPYIEGESLRIRLDREKRLPLAEAVRIAREVADALSHAHDHGIIHRDIKPENILLSGGHAVVADFGVALAVGGKRVTGNGIVVGTPAYMSPEQAACAPDLDGRTDQYALGRVLYEMLGGQPPSADGSAAAVPAGTVPEPVPPLRPGHTSLPGHVERALARALEKAPADRFSTVRQFGDALVGPASSGRSDTSPNRVRSVRGMLGWLGTIAAVAMLVFVFRRPQSAYSGSATLEATLPTVAVLPAEEIGDSADSWLAAGISQEIADRLTGVSGLRVVSPSEATARRLATAGASIRQLGHQAGVQYALRQSIRSDRTSDGPRQVRISLWLIRLADGTNAWAASYTDTLVGGSIFGLQARVAEQVAQALNVALLEGERGTLAARPTDNLEAYEAYLRGNSAVASSYGESKFTDANHRVAAQAYQQAVALDSGFAEAHARLSREYTALRLHGPALREAQRALALSPNLVWGHLALAGCYFHQANWEQSRVELATAERLAPNSAEVLTATAGWYNRLGESAHARRNYERAFAYDPLSWHRATDLGVVNFAFRQFPEAEHYLDRAVALADTETSPYMYKAWLYLSWHGSIDQTLTVLRAEVARLGVRRGFGSFLSSYWWVSRVLGTDPWYRGMLEGMTLEQGAVDSAPYYNHKAGLYEGLGQAARARAYWDSAASVLEGRWRQAEDPAILGRLAIAHAGQGRSEQALEEAGRFAAEEPESMVQLVILALVNTETGHREAAAAQFERLTRLDDGWVTPEFLALDPVLDSLRSVPRFRRLLQRN